MGNNDNLVEESNVTNPNILKAPTFNDLVKETYELREKLRLLEEATCTPTLDKPKQSPIYIQSDYRVPPEVDRNVPLFNGLETNYVAEDWISTVTGVVVLNGWNFNQGLHYVRAHVTGAARNWFLSEVFADWHDLEMKFREAFVQEIRLSDRWNELNQRNQEPEEHLVDYFYEKVRLCRVLKLPFAEIRDHVIQGLRSRDLAAYAMTRVHSSQNQLLSDLRDWERMRLLRRERFPAKSTSNSPSNKPRMIKITSTPMPVAPTKSAIVEQPRPQSKLINDQPVITCFNCRMSGHIARDCPKPRRPMKCSNCGSDRHTRGKCPVEVADSTMPTGDNREAYRAEITNPKTLVNPFAREMTINQLSVLGLIDSGCSNVLVRKTAAELCRAVIHPKRTALYTVGDTSRPGATAIGETVLDVTIDGVTGYDYEALVPDNVIPVDVLVGRTWLTLPHVNYYKKVEKLVFETSEDVANYVVVQPPEKDACVVDRMSDQRQPITSEDMKIAPQWSEANREELRLYLIDIEMLLQEIFTSWIVQTC